MLYIDCLQDEVCTNKSWYFICRIVNYLAVSKKKNPSSWAKFTVLIKKFSTFMETEG